MQAPAEALETVEAEEDGLELAPTQQQAIELVAASKVMVLTGGPGTGKTTVTRRILHLLEEGGQKVALCSPTGRASKRLSEASGREAGRHEGGQCALGARASSAGLLCRVRCWPCA